MTDAAPAPIGDNRPPEGIDDDKIYEDLKARADALVKTGNRWITERTEIKDERVAGLAATFIKQCRQAAKDLETERKARGSVFRKLIKAVDEKFNPPMAALKTAGAMVSRPLDVYVQAKAKAEADEKARIEAEALEKLRVAEEARKLAEAKTGDVIGNIVKAEALEKEAEKAIDTTAALPKKTAVRSEARVMASTRGGWTFEVLDYAKVELGPLRPHFNKAALDKAIRAYVKAGGRELFNVRIYEETATVVR